MSINMHIWKVKRRRKKKKKSLWALRMCECPWDVNNYQSCDLWVKRSLQPTEWIISKTCHMTTLKSEEKKMTRERQAKDIFIGIKRSFLFSFSFLLNKQFFNLTHKYFNVNHVWFEWEKIFSSATLVTSKILTRCECWSEKKALNSILVVFFMCIHSSKRKRLNFTFFLLFHSFSYIPFTEHLAENFIFFISHSTLPHHCDSQEKKKFHFEGKRWMFLIFLFLFFSSVLIHANLGEDLRCIEVH